MKYFCGRLWVAGDFTNAGGVNRTALVSLNPTTGAATGEVNLLISGTASGDRRPDPDHQDRAEPGLQARGASSATSPRSPTIVRYQVAVVNVSADRRPGVGSRRGTASHLRASQPGVGAHRALRRQPR